MADINDLVDAYIESWNETDEKRRSALLAQAWGDDARYVDPLADATGRDEIGRNIAAVQGQFPGHTFRRTTGVDGHHDRARFEWDLRGPDGSLVVAGVDCVELASDGRLQTITGFFGALEPAAAVS